MNNDRYNNMYMGDPMAMLPGGVAPDSQQTQTMWQMLDDRLRGRWTFMLIIGAVLAGILAFVGYESTEASFESTGVIRVEAEQKGVAGETYMMSRQPETERATQALLMRSRRVLELALREEKLAATEFAKDPMALKDIEEHLVVESDRNSELIFVSYESASPDLAQIVVNAVLHAYYNIFGRAGGEEMNANMTRLMDEESGLMRDIKAVQKLIQTRLAKYETSDISSWQERKQKRIEEFEMQITEARAILARSESKPDQPGLEAAGSMIPTDAALERMSPTLANYGAAREAKYQAFEQIKARYQPETFPYKTALREFETAKNMYDQERLRVLDAWQSNGGTTPGIDVADAIKLRQMSPDQLKKEIDFLEKQVASLRVESEAATADIQAVEDDNLEYKRLTDRLGYIRETIQQMRLNEQMARDGRISIAQEATRPLEVSSDGRKKRAAAGAAGGFALSFVVFFLIGTIDRRAYGAQQLKTAQGRAMPPCLGVLPDLSRGATDPEANDVAAHCVHQIRNQIEAQRPADQGFVLAMTSPCQGDGKTSIVLSLGWSYAAAGYRTLMIDCDLVGRSLTRQLGMVGKVGLREALARKTVNGEVVSLAMPDLSAMPVGFDASFGPERIRRHGLDVLFEQVRPHYDVIIVDTGPILGSLESTPVIAAADGVILTVRRGRSRSKLDEAVAKLETLGGKCIGVILNWAVRADCYRYVSDTSLPAADADQQPDDAESVTIAAPTSGNSSALILAMEKTATPQRKSNAPPSHADHAP